MVFPFRLHTTCLVLAFCWGTPTSHSNCSAEEDRFQELIDQLELRLRAEESTVTKKNIPGPKHAVFHFCARTYIVHHRNRTGLMQNAQRELGPSGGGFVLSLRRVSPSAVSAGAPILMDGTIIRKDYWWLYRNTFRFRLSDQKKPTYDTHILHMKYEYGSKTNAKYLRLILEVLAEYADEVKVSDGLPAFKSTIGVSRSTRKAIEDDVEKVLGELTVVRQDQPDSTTWKYNTREFQIHPIDDSGEVSSDTIAVEGPDDNGLIIKLSCRVAKEVSQTPSLMYGRISERYWESYSACYGYDGLALRLEMQYGQRVKRRLLENIVKAVDKHLHEPGNFIR